MQIKYIDPQTDAPTAARFRDKYERFGDRNPSFDRGGSGFNVDGVVATNKFIKGSKNQTRSAELGHKIPSLGKYPMIGSLLETNLPTARFRPEIDKFNL